MSNVIKWTGTKRYVIKQMLGHFPKFDTYTEPFLGGGSVAKAVLTELKPRQAFLSDACEPLVDFWHAIQNDPKSIASHYRREWTALQKKGNDHYLSIRSRFNSERNPGDFLFLSRTCYNGLIRFNGSNEFNVAFHHTRPGIHPDKLDKIIDEWHNIFKVAEIRLADYHSAPPSDFLFLDPPYADDRTHIGFDTAEFFKWLGEIKSKWALTYNGEIPLNVPSIKLNSSTSGFRNLKNGTGPDRSELLFLSK